VFNQTKTQFAFVWCNVAKEVEIELSEFQILKDYCDSQANSPMMNQGFSLYNAASMKQVMSFNQSSFRIAGLKSYTIIDISLLFEA